ncbi:copper resistance protein B [Xylophilus sp. GOD-11R]|uniref:copper resistance protein B n=1 Tax=Xylophilus sp. GOD-11R TaxID=3089814 RepID=UPI00298CEE89|nr:copper resistance protein B [Xylophilus sp. GOD-11R]WPB56909.1 copper resistance protein B [Xylophilus sp. GOD-11R]
MHRYLAGLGLVLTCAISVQAQPAMPAMDHDAMDMQGGVAPADARDPDAWSGGYRRGVGPYALGHGHHGMGLHAMADERLFAGVLVDRLERAGHDGTHVEGRAWIGNAYDKAMLKAESGIERGRIDDARTELLWSHAVATYWDTQIGLRHDDGAGRPARDWLAIGIQGLAPYWFELEATAYVGEGGRTALRLAGEYELLITQRLILQPRVEAQFQGRADPATGVGSGLTTGALGMRLRYEFSRQFAPYVGVERSGAFGDTADLSHNAGHPSVRTRWVAGLRLWF